MPLVKSHDAARPNVDCSIIIPVHNNLRYTKGCIDTLLRDPIRATCELIVVDNGSTDDTPVYLRSLAGRVTVISPGANLGFARANNLAARQAAGRFLVLLNNDTIPGCGWLDAMIETAASDERIAIVGAKLLYPQDRTVQHAGVVITRDLKLQHLYEGFPEDHPAVNKRRDFRIVTAACMLIKRGIYHNHGGLDENFINGFEDVDFCLRVAETGMRVVYEPRAVVLHYAEATAGRHDHENANAVRLTRLWRHKLTSDIDGYLREDGYKINNKRGSVRFVPRGVNMIELLDKARETLKEGNIGEALRQYEKINRADPDNATALSYLADINDRRGELDEAAKFLLRLSRSRPDAEVYMKLAQNSLKRRQYDSAKSYAAEAMNLAAGSNGCADEAHSILGDATYKSGDIDKAAEIYDAVLASDPHQLRALTGRGTVALTRKEYREAVRLFDRALTVHPHHNRAILGKGLAYMGLGRRREGADLVGESLLIEPDNGWAIATILPVLSESGKLDEADKALKRYLEHYPDDHPMLLARAGVAYALGRLNVSRMVLDKVLEIHPEYPGAADLDRELKRSVETAVEAAEPALA